MWRGSAAAPSLPAYSLWGASDTALGFGDNFVLADHSFTIIGRLSESLLDNKLPARAKSAPTVLRVSRQHRQAWQVSPIRMVSAEGIESALKRKFNNMQVSG
jgi:hypothetical protein